MSRLKNLGSSLATLRPSVAFMPQGEQERDKARASLPWRRWYNSSRWRALRLFVFQRDGYVCQATGVLLTGKAPAPDSPVADHRTPHHGNPAMFWDPANIWTVSKAYHDREKQKQERRAEGYPGGV